MKRKMMCLLMAVIIMSANTMHVVAEETNTTLETEVVSLENLGDEPENNAGEEVDETDEVGEDGNVNETVQVELEMVAPSDSVVAESEVEESEVEESVPEQYQSYLDFGGYEWKDGNLYYKGLLLNADGMYEVVDDEGKIWYYSPSDPEFDQYFVEDEVNLESSKVMLRSSTRSSTGRFTGCLDGVSYGYPSAVNGQLVTCGVDVSYYQGTIDWNGLKNAGVDYAIIRAGYRSLISTGLYEDPMFRTYVQQAYAAGIKVGVYFFSQACSEAEAIEEANYCKNIIASYKSMISLPVFMDYEYGNNSRLYNQHVAEINAGLDYPAIHTGVVNAFCSTMSSDGYLSGVYANRTMLNTSLNVGNIPGNYYIWLANYTQTTPYSNRLSCWQYRSDFTGLNAYIGSASIDCDFWFGDLPNITTPISYTYNGRDYAPVFNSYYYRNKYPDLQAAFGDDADALFRHFITYGIYEGRQACANFNIQMYRFNNDDLYNAFGDDLFAYCNHYIDHGRYENRNATSYTNYYKPVFDVDYYYSRYPDLQAAFGYNPMKLLDHFWKYGMKEGRKGNASFDVYAYQSNYADLQAAFGNNLKAYCLHYINYGQAEHRNATQYLTYSAVFDMNYYRGRYADMGAAFGENNGAVLNHFLTYGMKEGRQGCSNFNVYNYKNRYADLRAAYGNDLKAYYMHYLNYGQREGRNGR